MSTFTFNNVTIFVEADSAQEAYLKLCEQLKSDDIEYDTDSFQSETDVLNGEFVSTGTLFPV